MTNPAHDDSVLEILLDKGREKGLSNSKIAALRRNANLGKELLILFEKYQKKGAAAPDIIQTLASMVSFLIMQTARTPEMRGPATVLIIHQMLHALSIDEVETDRLLQEVRVKIN
jgi:hypothetical protein